jgi:hypothetical protein
MPARRAWPVTLGPAGVDAEARGAVARPDGPARTAPLNGTNSTAAGGRRSVRESLEGHPLP